ncbi:MAG: hypothetical protein HOV83_06550, partial [Catenulispora sp.]|nr:hypothetical protein [Catenulispora sp.]
MPHSLPPGPITVERPRAPRPDPLPEIPRQPDGVNGSPNSSSQEACPLREFGCVAAQRRPTWRLLSSHTTSDGV